MSSTREQARRLAGHETVCRADAVQRPQTMSEHPTIYNMPESPGGPYTRRMIPLESQVPDIGTPGSESRGWKRDDGSRTEAQSESDGIATGP